MKRYAFPLAHVLRVRRVEEDRAAGRLAGAQAEATAATEQVERRETALSALVPPATGLAASFLVWQDQVARGSDALNAATERCQAALAERDARRSEWSIAAMRVSALERFDDRRRQAHARQVRRGEAVEIDDVIVSRRRLGA